MGIEPTQPSWFYLPHILANFKKQVHGDIAQLLHSKARPVLAPVCPSFRAVNYTILLFSETQGRFHIVVYDHPIYQ